MSELPKLVAGRRIDNMVLMDPVGRFGRPTQKPGNVGHLYNVVPSNKQIYLGNMAAAVGGRYKNLPYARNINIPSEHWDTDGMYDAAQKLIRQPLLRYRPVQQAAQEQRPMPPW